MSDSDIFLRLAKKQQEPQPSTAVVTPLDNKLDADKRASMDARTHQHANSSNQEEPSPQPETIDNKSVNARMHARIENRLKETILNKKRLTSYTFRFKTEELDAIDRFIESELEKYTGQKISKNDIVRLGLNWLLLDFEEQKESSMLAKIIG
ncbi:MAG: hypothetical protein KDI79_08625 [Anaerolineae bacterium]|nr:hypothetical protein [Anaerolineae bacterium]